MRAMGWSWRELMDTPADLVREVEWRLVAEAKWSEERRRMDKAHGQTRDRR